MFEKNIERANGQLFNYFNDIKKVVCYQPKLHTPYKFYSW